MHTSEFPLEIPRAQKRNYSYTKTLPHIYATIMTAEEYQKIVGNQIILDKKLDGIIHELKVIKKDVNTAINNQKLLEQYEIEITEKLRRIEHK